MAEDKPVIPGQPPDSEAGRAQVAAGVAEDGAAVQRKQGLLDLAGSMGVDIGGDKSKALEAEQGEYRPLLDRINQRNQELDGRLAIQVSKDAIVFKSLSYTSDPDGRNISELTVYGVDAKKGPFVRVERQFADKLHRELTGVDPMGAVTAIRLGFSETIEAPQEFEAWEKVYLETEQKATQAMAEEAKRKALKGNVLSKAMEVVNRSSVPSRRVEPQW